MPDPLSVELMAHPRFQWVPGMRGRFGATSWRVFEVVQAGPLLKVQDIWRVYFVEMPRNVVSSRLWMPTVGWVTVNDDAVLVDCVGPEPDLADPGTAGCLVALLQEVSESVDGGALTLVYRAPWAIPYGEEWVRECWFVCGEPRQNIPAMDGRSDVLGRAVAEALIVVATPKKGRHV